MLSLIWHTVQTGIETGNYDDLFTETDLKLLKADIKVVKDYLSKHPELLED